MRKKRKVIIAPKCDWCGEHNQYFIKTASHLTFCREQVVGFPPTKDCHSAYIKSKENVQKEKEQKQSLQAQKEKQLQEEEVVNRAANVAKLEAYLKELKANKFKKRI